MPKKRDRRRQERRRHHQEAQELQRRTRRREMQATLDSFRHAAAELLDTAEDEKVTPEQWVERAAEVAGEGVFREVVGGVHLGVAQGLSVSAAAGEERSPRLAEALASRLRDHPVLTWLAVGLAKGAGDLDGAERMATEAMENPDQDEGDQEEDRAETAACMVAQLRIDAGRLDDALALLDDRCAAAPELQRLQELRAEALKRAAALPSSPEGATASLARFADRSLLYELRAEVERFLARQPELALWRNDHVASFISEARETAELGPFDELGGDDNLVRAAAGEGTWTPGSEEGGPGPATAAVASLAAEWAWLSGPEPPGGGDLPDDRILLARLAADPETPPRLAEAARSWARHVRYGLWQVQGHPGAGTPGTWVTDLVTRRDLYAAIPPEQLDGLPRWSVLVGTLAPLEGVWRSGATLLVMDPALADRTTEVVVENTEGVMRGLAHEAGIRLPRVREGERRPERRQPRPHGVLAELLEPMEGFEADINAKIVGASLANIVAAAEIARRQAPAMRNTDGDPMELFEATFPAADPPAVRRRLLADPDFEGDGDEEPEAGEAAAPLRWLGREMTQAEAESSLAQFRAEARRRGWGPVEEPQGPRRWLRGVLRFGTGEVRVEVNSRRRLDAVTTALRGSGAGEPRVERVLDPARDLPIRGRIRSGRAGAPEAEEAWRRTWLDEPVPALEGSTPRAAAGHPRRRVLLESLLRQFEHDADLAAAEGDRPMDVESLRAALDMHKDPLSASSPAPTHAGEEDG